MNAHTLNTAPRTAAATTLTQEGAAALINAARNAAAQIGIDVTIAITDAGGHLKAFDRADNAPFLTVDVAIDKAWTAASFGLSTLTWNAIIQNEGVAPLALRPRMVAVGGGYPLVLDGQVIGGIGISGGNAQQDHDACEAALKQLGFELR